MRDLFVSRGNPDTTVAELPRDSVDRRAARDLTDEDVAHQVWTTNPAEFYRLTTSRGRTSEHHVATVTDLWIRTLLA